MLTHKILYLHGFNSSSKSQKALVFQQYIANNFNDIDVIIPQLNTVPANAIVQLENIIAQEPNVKWHLVGSSLGGYYSTYLSEKYNIPTVLINPAVKPYDLLRDYLGEQTNPYTEEIYIVNESYVAQLKSIDVACLTHINNYFLLTQTDDEVLDYRQAVIKYKYCKQLVQEGGDHSFIHFDKVLPDIVKFFQFA